MARVAVREDCRHYLRRSTSAGDVVERCRVGANAEGPFACPEGCVFFEERPVSSQGWAQAPSAPMTNTAHGLLDLPDPPKKRWRGKKRR
jgi:hypothetical protein